jgi:NADP-dependent 3-hydroxy acid dehydrogenase YdfG
MAKRTALVTGASSGIGAAVARALAPTHDVWLGARGVVTDIPGKPWPVDLFDFATYPRRTAEIGDLDVLVHSAGTVQIASLAEHSVRTWREAFDLNVVAVAELTRVLLPKLRAAKGHVVLINSGSGMRANAHWGAYAASKFALRAYADVLRAEEPAIRVTSVFPGRTATPMQQHVREAEGGDYRPADYLQPETVAQTVLNAINTPPDAHPTEVVIRPRGAFG